jgi:chromosome segregation ATPase
MDNEFQMDVSPLSGLERLSADLQQERQKCTAALKDRAKQKIEIERLKQKNLAYKEELDDLRDRLEDTERIIQSETNELNQSTFKLNDKDKEVNRCKSELETAQATIKSTETTLQDLQTAYASLNADYIAARGQCDDENEGILMLEKQIQELKDSNQMLRSMKSNTDEAASNMHNKYADQVKELEEYKIRSRKFDTISEKYTWLQQNGEEVRRELEDTLRRNTALSRQSREAQDLATAREGEVHRYQDALEEATARIKELEEENKDILDVQKELTLQIGVHTAALAAERTRSEDARVNRQYLDAHVNELRDAHSSALQQCASTESELAAANTKISALMVELTTRREQAQQVEAAQQEAEHAHTLSVEVETLRGELTNVRKQLVRRDVEDEANAASSGDGSGLSSKAMSERETNSRKVYEGIIEDLRSSLDKALTEQYALVNQLELARRKGGRVEQLEEEVAMYRDAVKLVAVENKSAVMSVSEAVERTQKCEHENQNLIRKVRNFENENRLNQTELKRVKEELVEEKKKHRGVHVDKLSVERKIAEYNADRVRMEVSD